ncbi:MAG: hypothetical protein QOE69_3235, partial [Thermoleophilaceae bacterium]|jgi:hypothetical protein|nr:hypothetical protein [Thermoleophilaceae bacterium]
VKGSGSSASAASKRGTRAHAAADAGARASQADGPTDVQIADQTVDLPADASPSTLPFTGLQLALMALLGLAALAAGTALRRGVRERRA